MRPIAALCAFALLTAAAPPPAFDGPYAFVTRDRNPATGRPVCSETWTFGPGGALTVVSGEEVAEKTYRTEMDRDGSWLVTRQVKTNGRPDCMGNTADPAAPTADNRIYLMRFNNGTMYTCAPPSRTEDGIPLVTDASCYATLTPQKRT